MIVEDSLYDFYRLFAPESLLNDLYREELLTPFTLTATVVALGAAVVYYLMLNRKNRLLNKKGRNVYSEFKHWALAWLINGLIVLLAVLITCFQEAAKEQQRPPVPTNGLMFDQDFLTFLAFSLEMMLLAILLFFVFSVFMKRWSTHAQFQPFGWPDKKPQIQNRKSNNG